ncbi:MULTISPECIES: hybrid sensor histidine kinase/response regulator [unclassified Achromobacter]|uniref:hybrid sensor histidine kinase/response regulator n=1 Tax=unclassified Achromobacter TaxID=2626865 RepID=UPI000B51A747|nr:MULTISPECIES: hybrid sensor histidine kinase/response regulator [unclassified Achromobacter]OWT70321.1 hybrid sensor histidine kinase/response regulator [Achromobacter sp. HZ34]OWT71861.1 hybrid sensor histidine kinase/response regulator [Achromobacter sp. HZ28]
MNPGDDIRDASLLDLFLMEARTQVQVLNTGLLALERDATAADQLEACMRAAHSMKGAARIVGLEGGVRVAHVMEDLLVDAQAGRRHLSAADIDLLLRGADLLLKLPGMGAADAILQADAYVTVLTTHLRSGLVPSSIGIGTGEGGTATEGGPLAPAPVTERPRTVLPSDILPAFSAEPESRPTPRPAQPAAAQADTDRDLRVNAETLDRLLGLSSETLVESHRLGPFAASLLQLKRMQEQLSRTLAGAEQGPADADSLRATLAQARQLADACQQTLGDRMAQADQFGWRIGDLAQRLYDASLACRMRPFGDTTGGLPRMIRDLARDLGKQARLVVLGDTTRVDRDVLERLDAPLNHLLRNAVDHGIEPPAQRLAQGKPAVGTVTLEARHSAGMLLIEVADDGAGIDLDDLREEIVQRQLANAETAAALSESELLSFLFLPGFTTRDAVTEVSGRGVGLDVVQDMMRQLRGTARVHQRPGAGTRFTLEMPLSLSVARCLIVDIGDERYAFPLAYVQRALAIPRDAIAQLEGRQHFTHEGRQIGLVAGRLLLQYPAGAPPAGEVPVILLGDATQTFGIAVDRYVAERTLVVQPLDPRLGKMQDILAGALMDDGTPVLIVDVEDLLRSIEKRVASGDLLRVGDGAQAEAQRRKRVLVIDDSLTVRELERKLLQNRGYEVAVAVDGMDGWNMLRAGTYDLVVTDVDMPRMDGIELVTRIRHDTRLQSMHVMVVSYKDRPEDRQRGLDAGADYYLGKSSFHDDALLQAVEDLIGRAR